MRRILWPLLCLVWGVALAQAPLATFDGGALGYRLGYPSDWVLEQEDDGVYLNIQPPQGRAEFGRVAIEMLADPDVTGTLDEGIDEVLAGLRANLLPDLAVQSRTPTTVSGMPAAVVLLTGKVEGQPVIYRLVLTIQGRTGYVLFLEAASDAFAAFEPLFDQVQASLVLTPLQAAPTSPLAPEEPLSGLMSLAGTYADDQLRLVLEGPLTSAGEYVGTLYHGDQRYPVRAHRELPGLVGEFESGGNRFVFTATLTRDLLTFVTDGATYVLTREIAAPVTPINPIGPVSPTPPPVTPAAPSEVVANTTGSAFVGALAANGLATGRLDGNADRITFHTYVVDVPAGATRLTIELAADNDLDLAIKQGSEIQSYADQDQGGDWLHRDIGTQNPTTFVVDQPTPGPWYIDVMNALGAGQSGSYRLTVSTTGGF